MREAGQFAMDGLRCTVFNFPVMRVFAGILLLFLISCGDSSLAPENLSSPLGEGKGHFRGSSIGDRIDDILRREPIDSVVFSVPKQVVYSFSTDTTVLQVSYEFENDTLHTIQADWFFLTTNMLVQVQEDLSTTFDTRFARQEGDGDFEVWQAVRADGSMVEFTLMEATTEYGRPVLSLTVYKYE
jgi:hypothetical protein